jgi:hypothetical protein
MKSFKSKEEIYMKSFDELREKTLTPAEMKKREEIAKSIERDSPNMPMGKKMAIATATAKRVAEAKDPGEYDYEGDMAKNNLRTICRASGEMIDMLDENTNLPEWVQSKITLAEDYISSAYNYMMSESEEIDESAKPSQQASIAIAMKKAGKKPMNAEVKESISTDKLKVLARAGLVDQKNVERLIAAFKMLEAGKVLNQQQKDLILSSYGELASIVTGDSQTFQKAKKAVAESVFREK